MADTKIIDLKGFKGATLHLHLKDIVAPFFIVISGVGDNEIYYIRKYDKNKVEINLPVHPDKIKVDISSGKFQHVLIERLKIYHVPYKFNNNLVVYRSYPISQLKHQYVKHLPYGSPARFIPGLGLIQENVTITQDLPQPTRFFIRAHETGHYYYGTPVPDLSNADQEMKDYYREIEKQDEIECDKFACYQLINKGYNFSTVYHSIKSTLGGTHFNAERIASVYNEIKNMHKKLNLN